MRFKRPQRLSYSRSRLPLDCYWFELFDNLAEFDEWPCAIDTHESDPVLPVGEERRDLARQIDSMAAINAREDERQEQRARLTRARAQAGALKKQRARPAKRRPPKPTRAPAPPPPPRLFLFERPGFVAFMRAAAATARVEIAANAERERWRRGGFALFDRHARSLEQVRRFREAATGA